jgi:hypothetical protein
MGRPQAKLDKAQFESLCAMQCTEVEICDWFGITDKTLCAWCMREYNARFSEVFAQKRQLGKISLRRSQWELAKRNVAMAIFLGKQFLDQRDKTENALQFQPGSMGDFKIVIGPPAEQDDDGPDEDERDTD